MTPACLLVLTAQVRLTLLAPSWVFYVSIVKRYLTQAFPPIDTLGDPRASIRYKLLSRAKTDRGDTTTLLQLRSIGVEERNTLFLKVHRKSILSHVFRAISGDSPKKRKVSTSRLMPEFMFSKDAIPSACPHHEITLFNVRRSSATRQSTTGRPHCLWALPLEFLVLEKRDLLRDVEGEKLGRSIPFGGHCPGFV